MITGIILASGFSRRMGKDKLLMEFNGKKLLEWTLIAAKESSLSSIILVYRKEEIRQLGEEYGMKTIKNSLSELGQSESLKAGVRESSPEDSYMFLLGDQPFVDSQLIDRLIRIHKENPESIIIPSYNGKNAPPTIIPKKYREELLNIEGDTGARVVIKNHPDCVKNIQIDDYKSGFDIDKPSDLEKFEK